MGQTVVEFYLTRCSIPLLQKLEKCGKGFCPWEAASSNNTNLEKTPTDQVKKTVNLYMKFVDYVYTTSYTITVIECAHIYYI